MKGGEIMPDLAVMIAAVPIVTEFLKALLRRFGAVLNEAWKIGLACFGSVCVVGYYAITTETALSIGLVWILIQVMAGAVFGYKIVMKFRRDKQKT